MIWHPFLVFALQFVLMMLIGNKTENVRYVYRKDLMAAPSGQRF